ncbi:MAG: PD-(D/E)XK nuclease family protein, partial [Candidatus Dormibacteria bacterium]
LPEPSVDPDWSSAPAAAGTMALDRAFGRAVHSALLRWQTAVDQGAPPRPEDLRDKVQSAAAGLGFSASRTRDLFEHLDAYANGPWPKRKSIWLEHSLRASFEDQDVRLDLGLRIDRLAHYGDDLAIIDYKTIHPHAAQFGVDEWQLRTYGAAVSNLEVGRGRRLRLFIYDIGRGQEQEVSCTRADMQAAEARLLVAGRGVLDQEFGVEATPGRPCWSCGFRLSCPNSLALV